MHIRDGILCPEVCAAGSVLAAAAVGYSVKKLRDTRESLEASRLATAAALIFAAQMVNFPLPGLSASGHLLGGVLAGVLVGPWAGCLVMALVLTVQAVVFADGGLMSLGVNIVNMGVVGVWTGWALAQVNARKFGLQPSVTVASAMLAAPLAVLAAAAMFCLEFAASARLDQQFASMTGDMLAYHALIGVGEALMTGAILSSLMLRSPSTLAASSRSREPIHGGIVTAVVIAAFLAPFASSLPDGLEAVGDRFGFNRLGWDRVFVLADYAIPLSGLPAGLSVALAGLSGMLITMVIGFGVQQVLNRLRPASAPIRRG